MRIGISTALTDNNGPNYIAAVGLEPDPDEAITALFDNGEEGAWYDPSDSTTVFQDAAGTTPATVGDPVGLILDKSKGLTLGSELAINGTFDTDTGWAKGAGWTISGGVAQKAGGSANSYFSQNQGLTVGGWYKVEMDISGSQGVTDFVQLYDGVAVLTSFVGANGHVSTIVKVRADYVMLRGVTPNVTITVDNFSVKELPGNHATQTTSAARPILQQSGATPVLSGTELVTNGTFDTSSDWTTSNWTIGSGVATGDAATNGDSIRQTFSGLTIGETYKFTFDVVSRTTGYIIGVIRNSANTATIEQTANITATGQYTFTFVATETSHVVRVISYISDASIDNISVQEVTSWSGGLRYLDFDGVDDYMRTATFATISFPISSAIAAKCTGTLTSGSAGDFLLDGEANNTMGWYLYNVSGSDRVRLYSVTNGNANTAYSAATTNPFTENVYTGLSNGSSSFIRVNGTETSTPGSGEPAITQVTLGAIGGHPGTSGYTLNGNIYGVVLVDRTLTAGEITDLETYLASKSGVTLSAGDGGDGDKGG